MKNYNPKPLIEEHYHIQELMDFQDKRSKERTETRNRLKEAEEREDLIKDAKLFIVTDFYCAKCKEDFRSQSIKEVEQDWSCLSQRIAFYKSKCSKGHWVIRLITDREIDAFWMKSRKVALDRGNHFRDIMQPFETGYNMLYGKK